MKKQWTDEEISILHQNDNKMILELRKLLPNKTISQIEHKAAELGIKIKRRRKISVNREKKEAIIRFLRENNGLLTASELSKRFFGDDKHTRFIIGLAAHHHLSDHVKKAKKVYKARFDEATREAIINELKQGTPIKSIAEKYNVDIMKVRGLYMTCKRQGIL